MKKALNFLLAVALGLGMGHPARADLSIDQPPTEMAGIDPGDTFLPGMGPMVDDGDLPGFFPSMQVPGLAPITPYDTDGFSQDIPNDPFAPMAVAPPGVLVSIDDGDIGPGGGPPDNATELFYSPLPPAGVSFATKATESFLGILGDPPPIGLDDDVDAYEDRFLPGPPVGAYFSADWDAPGPLDPGDIYWSPLWTPAAPLLVCDDVTQMGIAPNEATPVDVDAVHLVPPAVCAAFGLPGGGPCFLFSLDNVPPPPMPFPLNDPGDIYITDCATGSALFLDDVTQMGIVPPPDEFAVFDIDSISVADLSPVCELDGDGFFDIPCGGADCDDYDGNTYPGAPELCDGKDNDCDLAVPVTETDDDGDGYVECSLWVGSDPGILGGGDCNDANPNIFPGNPNTDCDCAAPTPQGTTEVCDDGADNDCDGDIDAADADCGGGCAASAEASVPGSGRAKTESLTGFLACLLIPMALALGLGAARRKR